MIRTPSQVLANAYEAAGKIGCIIHRKGKIIGDSKEVRRK
jgi:hypothetical protein